MATDNPTDAHLMLFLNARADEIRALDKETRTKRAKLAQQRLPRHMRRRAASHNPKRVPASVRLAHGKVKKDHDSQESKPKKEAKDKKKRYRNVRSKKASLKERLSQADKLPLHLWFVKRFAMESFWNYRMPVANSTKNARVLYRQAKQNFIFFYLAQWKCIQVQLDDGSKLEQLDKLLGPIVRQLRGQKTELISKLDDGLEHGIHLYEVNRYPHGYLGPAFYTICTGPDSGSIVLSLWHHVSVTSRVSDLITELLSANDFNVINTDLQRIRIVGPKSLMSLNKICETKLGIKPDSLLEKFFLKSPEYGIRKVFSNLQVELPKPEGTTARLTLIKGSIGNGFLDKKTINASYTRRNFVDLICDTTAVYHTWSACAKDRGHLVGGIRDQQTMFFNSSIPLYPHFGCGSKLAAWNQLSEISDRYVVRDSADLQLIQKRLNSSAVEDSNQELPAGAFAAIDIRISGKGKCHDDDLLCLPEAEDLLLLPSHDQSLLRNSEEPLLCSKRQDRPIIGYLERGSFHCWSTAGARGMGLIHVQSLLKHIDQMRDSNGRLVLLIKSPKCTTFRFGHIFLLDTSKPSL